MLLLLLPGGAFAKADSPQNQSAAQTKHLALMYSVRGEDVAQRFDDFITKKLQKIGYKLTDPHRGVNKVYKKLYGRTALDLLSFLPVVNDEAVKPLLNIDPRIAGFNPFNMLIYRKIGEEEYHMGHMSASAMFEIIGITDPAVKDAYNASLGKLDDMMAETFGREHSAYLDYKALPQKRMLNYILEFERPEYIDDFVDEFQESFEDIFAQHSYVIAGFHNFMEDEEDETLSDNYDAFWTYSLCHMKYSSTIFDNEGMCPEAGVFAPCTMYMFIPKGSNKLYIGMPRLANVKVALDIQDKKRVAFMDKLDKEIPSILEEMGAKEVENVNPLQQMKKAATREAASATAPAAAATFRPIEITDKKLANIFVFDGNIEEKYNTFVEKTINQIGFRLTDPHKRVNDHYKEKYGSTTLDVLSFMSIANEDVVKPLFNIDPRIAGFNPFNFMIYKKKDEKKSYIGHLRAGAILDMLSITDEKVRTAFTKSLDALDALIRKELGGKEMVIEAKDFAKDRMMNFVVPFEPGEDIEDVVDAFQEKFEGAFEEKDYIIAGFNNFKETDGEDTIPQFDAFWTYSLCHFKFSYTVFDNEGGVPQAALFAPCTMYMYIKKGENRIVIGMPRLANWKATLGIEDKVRSDFIAKLDHDIPEIMTQQLGAVEIENSNPLIAIIPKKGASQPVVKKEEKAEKTETEAAAKSLPEAKKRVAVAPVKAPKVETRQPAPQVQAEPKQPQAKSPDHERKVDGYKIELPKPPAPPAALDVITVGGSDIRYTPRKEHEKGIIFSMRRPPDVIPESDSGKSSQTGADEGEKTLPGLPVAGRVSTYLHAPFVDVAQAKANLEKAGFRVLSVTPLNKKGTLKTVTFTSDELLDMAKKRNSGFVGVMRLLVNKENNEIAVTNPLYFARAYMGEAYDREKAEAVVRKLNSAFKGLQNSGDKLKFTLLPKYRFMEGMPYYKDMVTIAKGASSGALLEKLKTKGKALDFVQQIGPDSYLVGVELGKRTSKFIKKTGYHNAFLLPYPVLIEKGEAKIMDPKYYISVNYPKLKMSQFMKIATVPDAIKNDCRKLFR